MGRQIVYKTDGTHYQNIQVVDIGEIRYLRFGLYGGWQGALCLSSPERLVFPYQRAFSSLLSSLPQQANPRHFLSIGVGTGTALQTVSSHFPDCRLCGIDIDPTVVDIAIRFFKSPDNHSTDYITGDGIHLVNSMHQESDLIFVDVYDSNQIDPSSLDPAFASTLHNALSDSGIVVCNVIGQLPPSGAFRLFLNAAKQCFPRVAFLPVGNPFSEQNILLVLAKHPDAIVRWKTTLSRCRTLAWYERLTWPLRLQVIH